MSSTAFVNGSTLSDAGWANDVDTFVYSRLTSVSGTNTVVGTGPVSMTAYATGQRFTFIPAATNTGATTLNITPSGGSALGAKNIFCNGAACTGGEIRISVPCEVFYDGTQFNIINNSYIDTTFTPKLFLGSTEITSYLVQEGTYQQIGRVGAGRIYFDVSIRINVLGAGTGDVTVTNMPVARRAGGDTTRSSFPLHVVGLLSFTTESMSAVMLQGSSVIQLYSVSNGSSNAMSQGNMQASGQINITGSYPI